MGQGGPEPFEHWVDHGNMHSDLAAVGALRRPPARQHPEAAAIRFLSYHGQQETPRPDTTQTGATT